MAAQKYEICPKVLKNFPWVSAANKWNIFELEKRKFVSPSSHGMFYILYKHQWNAKPFHFNFFGAKGAMYYVAIATVIFSHVKISCFCVKAHLVFHWLLQNELCLVVRDLNFPCTWPILLRPQQYFWEKRRRISIKLKQLHPNIWPIMSHIQNKWVSLKKLVSQQGENIESDNIIQTMIF